MGYTPQGCDRIDARVAAGERVRFTAGFRELEGSSMPALALRTFATDELPLIFPPLMARGGRYLPGIKPPRIFSDSYAFRHKSGDLFEFGGA